MKNKRVMSVLIILLCLSLCIGATYAYFTDSATSSRNKIQAGKLKIDLELLNKDTLIWNSIKESQDPIFNYEYWEPGYTDVKLLKVENEETLAVKWEARFIYESEFSALADAIKVYVKTSENEFAYPTSRDLDDSWEYQGTLAEFASNIANILNGELLSGESNYFGIALYMPTTVEDNTLQGEAIDPFDIQIFATQLAHESDAFDEKYDENAESSNGEVTPPGETESESDPTTSSSEPEPTDDIEPTDSDIFTWSYNGDGTYIVTGFKDDVTVPENLVIPDTYNGLPVTAIGNRAFYGDSTIESVVIPNSVTTIGDYAFRGCKGLTGELIIPDSVTTIGDSAFNWCSGLTGELIIPDSVTTIDDYAFFCCSNLTSVTIGDGVTTIGDYAFHGCEGLTSVTIGNSVTTIGDSAFCGCDVLTSIEIPNTVTTIGDSAFQSCSSLTSVTIPDSVTTIGTSAFNWCSGLTSVTIGNGVITIGDYAFYNCFDLTSVTIGNGVTTIGEYAFYGCSGLTNIEIPNTVTTIGKQAFRWCNLTTITFDSTIEQWNSISKEYTWDYNTGKYTIYCIDGTIAKNGTVTYY